MVGKFCRFLHFLVANLLHYSGLLSLRRFIWNRVLHHREVCILGLHRVLTEEQERQANSLGGMILKEATFVKVLDYISRRFKIVPLEEFLKGLRDGADRSRPWCLLTFDDGWGDNYTTAYPWLKRFGVSATIFLATGLIGGEETFWVERLKAAWKDSSRRAAIRSGLKTAVPQSEREPEIEEVIEALKQMPADKRRQILAGVDQSKPGGSAEYNGDQMLNWDQVTEMSRDGIDFGSHTVTHPLLIFESDATIHRELQFSRETLSEKLNRSTRAFAYPNGAWDDRVRHLVKEAGFDCAFTTERGLHRCGQDPYTIRRVLIHEGSVTGLNGKFSAAMLSFRLSGRH